MDGGVNVLVDVTDRKTASHLRNALISDLERKETAILGLVDSVLKETRRQAQSAEAQELIEQAIGRVATISATQSYLYDPSGATRINSWDLLSAICITAQMPVQDRVELVCESAAGDLASETAMPLVLIAKELIANAAKHGLARTRKDVRARCTAQGIQRIRIHGRGRWPWVHAAGGAFALIWAVLGDHAGASAQWHI